MRLLLAEDEKELSNALCAILKHNHYEIDAVYNGQDALDYILTDEYDGVILDVMMPGMDGIQVLKKVRASGMQVPILMLTAKTEIDDRVLGLDEGADDYLGKPFATKELLARLRAILRRRTENNSAVLCYGDIQLDTASFSLSVGTSVIRLPNKEYQILYMLLMNPHQIISTERLFEKIWGYDSEADLSVVWVYISYLRKKLTSLQSKVRIKAIRNQGYTLEEGVA